MADGFANRLLTPTHDGQKKWQSESLPEGPWIFSPKQMLTMFWWQDGRMAHADGIIADGSVRSGKTTAFCFGFMMWSMINYNAENFAVCGKTIASFQRNVLDPMKKIAPYLGYTLTEQKSDHSFTLRSIGGKINRYYIFGGKDEGSQDLIQGITIAGLLLDEVVLMPESFVNQAFARCSVSGAKIWMNANPAGPTHFVKKRFVDGYNQRNFLHIHFMMDDNYSLSPERRVFYSRQWTGVFYRRYILGEWCLADGLVYSMYDEDKHLLTGSINLSDYERIIVGVDYGIQNPTAYIMIGFNGRKNRLEIIKEYYYSGREEQKQKTDDELYKDLVEFVGDINVEGVYCDPSATSFIAQIKKKRQLRVKQADNEVEAGIAWCAQLFNLDQLFVHASCKNMRAELASYAWDTEKSEERGEDVILKVMDHACDAMRYALYTHFRPRAREYRLGYYQNY